MSTEQRVGRAFLDVKEVVSNAAITDLLQANTDKQLDLSEDQITSVIGVIRDSLEKNLSRGFDAIIKSIRA